MSDTTTTTTTDAELAAAQDVIAGLRRSLAEARERERIATEAYNQQQTSYRELETLYQAATERALKAEADAAAQQKALDAAVAYVTYTHAAYHGDTNQVELWAIYHDAIRTIPAGKHPGAALLAEHDALAAWACESCGARFAESVRPAMLEGVTRCSKCVEVDQLRAALRQAARMFTITGARRVVEDAIGKEPSA